VSPALFESPFEVALAAGYDGRAGHAQGVPTQRTRPDGTPAPPPGKLDRFLARGLEARQPRTLAAVDDAGRALFDHEFLAVTIRPA
jgi:hypothetical protein